MNKNVGLMLKQRAVVSTHTEAYVEPSTNDVVVRLSSGVSISMNPADTTCVISAATNALPTYPDLDDSVIIVIFVEWALSG